MKKNQILFLIQAFIKLWDQILDIHLLLEENLIHLKKRAALNRKLCLDILLSLNQAHNTVEDSLVLNKRLIYCRFFFPGCYSPPDRCWTSLLKFLLLYVLAMWKKNMKCWKEKFINMVQLLNEYHRTVNSKSLRWHFFSNKTECRHHLEKIFSSTCETSWLSFLHCNTSRNTGALFLPQCKGSSVERLTYLCRIEYMKIKQDRGMNRKQSNGLLVLSGQKKIQDLGHDSQLPQRDNNSCLSKEICWFISGESSAWVYGFIVIYKHYD